MAAAKRKRDYAAEYQRRVAGTQKGSAARQAARGHKQPAGGSEYQRRVQGTAPGSEARARAAGRRGFQALLGWIGEGSLVGIDPSGSERDSQGRWVSVEIMVLDARGRERVFRLRRVSDAQIRALVARMDQVGAVSSPSYPPAGLLRR